MVRKLILSRRFISIACLGFSLCLGFGSPIVRADILDSIEDLEKLDRQKTPRKPPPPEQPLLNEEETEEAKEAVNGTGAKPSNSEPTNNEATTDSGAGETKNAINEDKKPPRRKKSDAEVQAERRDRSKAPIELKSQGQTTYARNGGLIQLREDVVITQADLRLQSDEAKIYLNETSEENDVEKVEVYGQVKMTKFDEIPSERVTARGERAVFFNSRQKVELIGNARLWKGGHLIRGKKITYDIPTGMITVDQAVGVVRPEEGTQ